ncbi:MAG: cytidine deaminase [Thermoanaerobaculia bacterium]|nr:cytidine deaminase [Thermoanaerobaculia bacterium]
MTDWEALADEAVGMREKAYAPYSRYRVGAALETADGRVFTGCNIENRAYGLTLCAERVALAGAVAAGAVDLTALVVATESSPPQPPCGACRESLAEFASRLPILLVNPAGEQRRHDLAELLPHPFEMETRDRER